MVRERIVEIQCISHCYPDDTEVSICGLEFYLEEQEVVGILGANGSGKTTLLSHITGLLAPTKGQVRVFGREPHTQFKHMWQQMGVLLQSAGEQLIGPTVREDIGFSLKNAGWPQPDIDARVAEVMRELCISHLGDRIPHYLSGGEQQKVALAGALALRPKLLILDEPFASVDQKSKRELIALLNDLNEKHGTAILFTVHEMSSLPELAHIVYVMKEGELLVRGTPQDVLTDAALLQSAGLESPPLIDLANKLHARGINVPYTLEAEQLAVALSRMLAGADQ